MASSAGVARLEALVGAGIRTRSNVAFSRLTTFRVGGPAEILVEPDDPDQLAAATGMAKDWGVEVLVIGRGSNVLMSDAGFHGMVIRLGRGFGQTSVDDGSMTAGAAVPLPQAANAAARASLGGLEFCVAIPGSVGGGLRMNAGAHSSSMQDVLTSVEVFDIESGRLTPLPVEALGLGYRRSALRPDQVVTQARMRLEPSSPDEIADKMQRYREHRSATQPTEAPNAGSMFANPHPDSAGRLIEAAGAKGLSVGRAEVSSKHANFFLAHEGATAQEIFDLMALIQQKVETHAGVVLRPEVRLIGEFTGREKLRDQE